MKVVKLLLAKQMPVLNARGGMDTTSLVIEQKGMTMTFIPHFGVLLDVAGHDPMLIPLATVCYARIARDSVKPDVPAGRK